MNDAPTIGVLSPLVGGFYSGDVLRGIARTVNAAGGRVIAIQTLDAGQEYADGLRAKPFSSRIAFAHIDGVVAVLDAAEPQHLAAIQRVGTPLIMVSHEVPGVSCPVVVPDNETGVASAVHHLVSHGHTRIAFAGSLVQPEMRDRFEAYRRALESCGIQPDPGLFLDTGDLNVSGGIRAAHLMLACQRPATATFVATDLNAIGMTAALSGAGYKLPQDHAIIGFDDIEAARYAAPTLSTVRQDASQLGDLAADLVLRSLRGETVATGRHAVPTSLIRRESCGCVSSLSGQADTTAEVMHPGIAQAELTRSLVAAIGPSDGTIPALAVQKAALLLSECVAAAAGGLPAVAGELTRLVDDLYVLAPCDESAAAIVDAFRLFGRHTAAGRHHGELHWQRIDGAVVSATAALSEVRLRMVYEQGEFFRSALSDEYDVNLELLRGHGKDPRELGWLQHTRCSAGVLGLWTSESEASLQIVGGFDRGVPRDSDPAADCLLVESFPPAALMDSAQNGEIIFAVQVNSAERHWGWLATVGPVEKSTSTRRETLSQWATLLTVALDESAAAESRASLEREFGAILENSPDAIARYDAELRYEYLNTATARALGRSPEDIVGRRDRDLGRARDVTALWEAALRQVLASGTSAEVEYAEGQAVDGGWYQARMVPQLDASGVVVGVLTSTRDITALKRAERVLAHRVLHDPLTGLANRAQLLDRLTQRTAQVRTDGSHLAVLFIDLDGFKAVNDSLGHEAGDRVLVNVARRLTGTARRTDIVARLGGDEFVVLCDTVRDETEARAVGNRVVRSLAKPMYEGDQRVDVSGSVGVVLITEPAADVAMILRCADSAMYRAKERGGNRIHVFDLSPSRSRV